MHYIFGPCTVELNNILISLTHGKNKFGYFDIIYICYVVNLKTLFLCNSLRCWLLTISYKRKSERSLCTVLPILMGDCMVYVVTQINIHINSPIPSHPLPVPASISRDKHRARWITVCIESCLPIGWHTFNWWKNPPVCCSFFVWSVGYWNSLLTNCNPKNNWCFSRIFGARFGGKDRGLSAFKPWFKQAGGWIPFLHEAAQNFDLI